MKTIKTDLPAGKKVAYARKRGVKVKLVQRDPSVKTRKQRRTEENKCVRKAK